MANTLTGLIPTLYSALDVVSREMVGFIPAVSKNTSDERAGKDQTITVPIAPAASAQDISPAVSAPDSGDQAIGSVSMTISKSRAVPIRWNGEEQKSIGENYNGILRDQFAQGMRTLVNEIEADLAATYISASRAYGTAGTTPFATAGDFSDFAQAKKILEDNGAPATDMKMVLGSAAIANVRGKQSSLFKANEAGTDSLLREGILGRVEGFDIHNSAQVKAHTKGTGTGFLVNDGDDVAVGDTAIAVDTGTGTVVAGDVVTFAADGTNKYIVASELSGGSLSIAAPGALVSIPNNNAVTVGDNYTANMAFSKSAMQLITRAPAMPVGPNGKALDMADDVIMMTDPFSGITFEISVYKQFRQLLYYVGLAWGVKCIKPEHAMILLG